MPRNNVSRTKMSKVRSVRTWITISTVSTVLLTTLIYSLLCTYIIRSGSTSTAADTLSLWYLALPAAVLLPFFWFFSHSLVSPMIKKIKSLEKAVVELSEGNLNFTLIGGGNDEISRLVDALDKSRDRLREYIGEISRGLSLLSEGDFTFQTGTDFKGEFYEMKLALDKIQKSLKSMIRNIKESAEKIDDAADQAAANSQLLSTSTTEQAASIQQLSVTMLEISKKVDQNAADAGAATRKTHDMESLIQECNREMHLLISAMKNIEQTSGEINNIIKSIEDIAFQTNILALNAAVEAARAGDAGKGFAVVADEVRNLASKSAEAAKMTTGLIQGTVDAVAEGNKAVDATAGSLSKVVDNVKALSSLIDEIARASADQSSAIEQVNAGAGQLSAVVQTNSAAAEESAANSQELAKYSEDLKALIRKYEI